MHTAPGLLAGRPWRAGVAVVGLPATAQLLVAATPSLLLRGPWGTCHAVVWLRVRARTDGRHVRFASDPMVLAAPPPLVRRPFALLRSLNVAIEKGRAADPILNTAPCLLRHRPTLAPAGVAFVTVEKLGRAGAVLGFSASLGLVRATPLLLIARPHDLPILAVLLAIVWPECHRLQGAGVFQLAGGAARTLAQDDYARAGATMLQMREVMVLQPPYPVPARGSQS